MTEVPDESPAGAGPQPRAAELPLASPQARHRPRKKVRREVDEGLMLLEHAVRLQVRNRIVVDVLTTDGGADVDAWRRATLEVLERLQGEAETTWRQLKAQIDQTKDLRGKAGHEHDYRSGDFANLLRRRRIARSVTKRVRAWAADPARVDRLLTDARQEAWEEVRTAIHHVVDSSSDVAGDGEALQERLDLIREVDLPALAGRSPRNGRHLS